MKILEQLLFEARKALEDRDAELRIDNIILGKTLYTMSNCDEIFTDMNFCLVLLEDSYGFSYFQGEIDYSVSQFVNKSALSVVEDVPIYMRIAIVDALFCLLDGKDLKKKILRGNIREKARMRAKVLLSHVPKGASVLLLGAATEIIEEAENKGCNLRVLDLEKQKVGLKLSSTQINDGIKSSLEKEIRETEYVIATGMIFVSETADDIFELTKRNGKNLALFMETGSNFGSRLLAHGAKVVLSEFFPYYDFFGDTKYIISTKSPDHAG
jgi:hypothetical protein